MYIFQTMVSLDTWHESESGETYAFPQAASPDGWWGEEILTDSRITGWTFQVTLPAGTPVISVQAVDDDGHKVRCELTDGTAILTIATAVSQVS